MGKFIDLTGQTFSRLTVLYCAGRDRWGTSTWVCQCSCGTITEPIVGKDLRRGHTISCGCRQREAAVKSGKDSATHGQSQRTREYERWKGITQRCTNPNLSSWKYYGGRGIVMCERWLKFDNFIADMGTRPESTSIGRILDRGNYEPGNVFWQTREEQELAKRNNRALVKWEKERNEPNEKWV